MPALLPVLQVNTCYCQQEAAFSLDVLRSAVGNTELGWIIQFKCWGNNCTQVTYKGGVRAIDKNTSTIDVFHNEMMFKLFWIKHYEC